MTDTHTTPVNIRISGDDDAQRITAVLEALGYEVHREPGDADRFARVRAAATYVSDHYRLTRREHAVLVLELEGLGYSAIADKLEFSRATVKWHMHNIRTKTNTGTREALLRLVAFGQPCRDYTAGTPISSPC